MEDRVEGTTAATTGAGASVAGSAVGAGRSRLTTDAGERGVLAIPGAGAMMLKRSRWIEENSLLIANLAQFAAFFGGHDHLWRAVYNPDQA